jgi:hypothetical protein
MSKLDGGRFAVCVGLAGVLSGLFLVGSPPQSASAACEPDVAVKPMSAGRARVAISAPCFSGRKVRLRYETVELVRFLDERGRLTLMFSCFLGDKIPLAVSFQDGPEVSVQLRALDLDQVTMVAVAWKAGVNLDLHAFEYAASHSGENHVWAGAPSSPLEAKERARRDNRGHGFISFASDGAGVGDQIEVYTFVHEPNQISGAVTLALDYESRTRNPRDPDTCGTGLYDDLEYRVFVRHPDGKDHRSRGMFTAIECDEPIGEASRYSTKALPQILVMR